MLLKGMANEFQITPALSDALTILAAAGVVIPTFARFRINPVIGFIIVGIVLGPFGLGALTGEYPWLEVVTMTDAEAIAPFAELGIVLLLFSIGLELSFRRLFAMRKMVFGIGAAEMLGTAALIGGFLIAVDWPTQSALWLSLALAMSSTALVLPISGTQGPVGRAALSMLLFEDLALVPMLFLIGAAGGAATSSGGLGTIALLGTLVILGILVAGRFLLPSLFAQAARSKKPELFLAISLLVVILSATLTASVGLSPILGALVAGLVIAETDYHSEVEVIIEPLKGLALGVFLISVGMRVDVVALLDEWALLLGALAGVLVVKAIVTSVLLRLSGARPGVAAETGVLMASPSETTLIVLGAAGAVGILTRDTVAFWSAATAIGLTITPLLASIGRWAARRVDRRSIDKSELGVTQDRTVIVGFGRVGRVVADMLDVHGRPYLAIENDIDGFIDARTAGYSVMFGDIARRELVEKLELGKAKAVVLTMDDPVLATRVAKRLREVHPDLPIIARARDTEHAARLYKAGVTDAVPEAVEASLQLSEAVLVDIGVAMGPVIASIHEKRSELRATIMREGELDAEPTLGRRRLKS
jgi:CPA2 family monovalent cation:H+ antiporter-2